MPNREASVHPQNTLAENALDAKDFGIGMNEVYSPPPGQSPLANIILVHGLLGNPWETWAAKAKSPRSGFLKVKKPPTSSPSVDMPSRCKDKRSKDIFWPHDLLPSAVENVKVYSFGYDADVERFMSPAGLNTVHQHGRNFFNELYALRGSQDSQVPTIIVAHSLGGLVVKEALNQAAYSAQQDERDVVSEMSGIIFLGTPHRGSNAASHGRMVYLFIKAIAFQKANTKLLTALKTNSETLDRISTQFYQTLESYRNLRIASFSEEKRVRIGLFWMQIVRPDSAKIGHAREAWGSISQDHCNMTKYSTLRDDGFVKVSRKIKNWVRVVPRPPPPTSTDFALYEECLKSLNDPVARFRVQDVEPVRHKNKDSFEWLFTKKVPFTRWLSDNGEEFDAIFWITGNPGSGKSTLMRFALEDSRTMSRQQSKSKRHPMAYFFHLRGKSLVQKSLRGMLMELLYQILLQYPRSFELISPIYLNLKRLDQCWDIRSLSEAILHIPHIPPAVSGCRDRITLFIDALDENQKQDDNNTLLDIFDSLIETYRSVRDRPDAPVLKICLASRPWPIFRERLGDNPRVPSFAIHEYTAKDIQKYTDSRLCTGKKMFKVSSARQKAISQLSTDIASRAKGVFIWVRVVVDDLSQEALDGTSIESLRKKLQRYPEELDEMYNLTLKRVREAYRPETVVIFKTMLASRVALTVLQLYIITNICMGSPPSENDPNESPDELISWLASRSGGLINIVDTGADKQRLGASGGGSDSNGPESMPDSSTCANLWAEFLHQTVQDFVRNSLDDGLEMVQTKPAVAQVSGSRLLAFACLDRHPPHYHLQNIAKDIFSYIREVEREDDETESEQITLLPHWHNYDIHFFPFGIRDPTQPLGVACTTSEAFFHYLDFSNPLAIILAEGESTDNFYDSRISAEMKPFVVAILQDLYHTKGPEHLLRLTPKSRQAVRFLLLFIASVGPRLSNDRVDRRRMFRHILTSYVSPLKGTTPTKEYLVASLFQLQFRPINERLDHVSITSCPGNLASILASSKPSTDLDDDTLLAFAEGLDGEGYMDTVTVEVPEPRISQSPVMPGKISRTVEMTLAAFCSRFRESNRSKWVDLFWDNRDDCTLGLQPSPNGTRPFVDLAAWDAVGREPPRQIYTALADTGGFVAQAIASIGMQAAVVGAGGSRLFRAFHIDQEID